MMDGWRNDRWMEEKMDGWWREVYSQVCSFAVI